MGSAIDAANGPLPGPTPIAVTAGHHPSPQAGLRRILERCRVLPVLTVGEAEAAVAVVRALEAGGLTTVEITLRSAGALAAIEAVARELPGVTVGAGTVTRREELRSARDAGASFAVSPGISEALIAASGRTGFPWLPGVATASEAMAARDAGCAILKLFPARILGGPALLAALRGPLPELSFCPTGGIDEGSFRSYLEEPNVLCVGGSWMVPPKAVADGDWPAITRCAERVLK